MNNEDQMLFTKIKLVMGSPAERAKYTKFESPEEKLSFLIEHFIMNEMAVRLLEMKQELPIEEQKEFIDSVDNIIFGSDQ